MAFEFKLPDIGEGMVEGEIVKWHVKVGDSIKEDQPMVDVMTDKATVTIPAPASGRILQILVKEAEIATVGATLIVIETNGCSFGASMQPSSRPPYLERSISKEAPASISLTAPSLSGKALAAPAVRKLARELGVELDKVVPTGEGGRVTPEDVRRAASKIAGAAGGIKLEIVSVKDKEDRIPLKGLRRKIAENMTLSKNHIPHFTYVEEVDVTELVAIRNKVDSFAAKEGIKLTYLPFIMKGLVYSLKKFPALNSTLDEKNQEIILKKYYNLGIASATAEGLTVFVIKDPEHKSIFQLARELETLGGKAQKGALSLEDVSGSTFTITSLGLLGGILATPIIYYPETAILGVHRIRSRPVVENKEIVIREMMNLSLSLDHRVIDGHTGAMFIAELIHYLEEPSLLFMEMV